MPKQCTKCDNQAHAKGLCKYHYWIEKKKEYAAKAKQKPSKPRTPIAKQSKKMKKQLQKYRILRKLYLQNYPECEAKLNGCTYRATEIHHSKGRGSFLCDVSTFLAVCRTCHTEIELKPLQAKEMGLSESRLKKGL